ncbi:MAG TPA: KR domain-containing protein, partial [Planctomycetota bacterium]|nr:KR domain-containing protein [Planctomycetota bacterium]
EAHGTGTRVGDAVEVRALTEVFREARPTGTWCALGSVKSQVGHTKAAAGAAGILKAALALHHRVLPPTIKVRTPAEALASGGSPFYLNPEPRPWLPPRGHPRRAAVSSFGFGGSNFHCVLEECGGRRDAADWDGDHQVIPFAAGSRPDLAAAVAAFPASSPWPEVRAAAAAARRAFDPARPFRLVVAAEREKGDLARVLESALARLSRDDAPAAWSTPDGAHAGEGPAPGRLAFLFPGQGSQYPGMLRDLACRFPEVLDALAEADEAFAPAAGGRRLGDLVHPPRPFDDAARARQEEDLRATEVAQPALGAVSLGAWRLLEAFGVRPDAAAGHSYGELPALFAADRYDARALHRLSGIRGRVMAGGRSDLGSMLAVQAPAETVESVLREERISLVVANRNAPNQAVVSGAAGEIDRAAASFASREIRAVRLPVGAAFHSPLVAHAREPMRAALGDTEIRASRIPVFSNRTASEYPEDADAARDLLAGQLAEPVEFVRTIENMHAAGVRTFLEVGPGARLTGLVGAILQGRPHAAAAIDASSGRRSGVADLAQALARLAALGHAVDLSRWDPAPPALPDPASRPAFTVELSGANYRSPTSAPAGATVGKPAAPPSAPAVPAALSPAVPGDPGTIAALVRLAERTAEAHRQFLEGQDRIREALEAVLAGGPAPARVPASTGMPSHAPPEPLSIPTPATAPAAPSTAVATALLDAVASKTGYPVETLSLDMGLDADLGIDSIKRVEILSSLQERFPGLPAVRPERLGTFRTLREIAEFLAGGSRGTSSPGTGGAVVGAAPAEPSGALASALLAAVADRTGYPVETLDLDMGLDVDLGIDSIKRVEILSAVQERVPGLPAVKPEMLGRFRSLREIVAFLSGRGAAETVPAPARAPAPAAPAFAPAGATAGKPAAASNSAPIGASDAGLLRTVVRSVPWTPPASRDAVPVAAGAEVWVTDSGDGLAAGIAAALRVRGFSARVVPAAGPAAVPDALGGLVVVAPRSAGDGALRDAVAAAALAAPAVRKAAREGGAFLATVSRIDGAFGFAGGEDAAGGGLAGLLKTALLEWPGAAGRAFDLDPAAGEEAGAIAVAAEVLLAGPLETGIGASGFTALEEVAEPTPSAVGPFPVGEGDVVVVTGGARGVTAAAARALARAARPTLVLLGRSPVPGPEPEWAAGRATEADLKRAFVDAAGHRPAPREVEEACRAVLHGREVRATLSELEALGSRVVYRAVDCRDALAVRAALVETRRDLGPVAGIVHGAGVLADALLERKTAEQADRVIGTKVGGLRALLDALNGDDLRFLALFSSTTARRGRVGQSDYAVANEALNRLARREARRRPGCRVVSLGWGPWEGGMVTPALARVFAAEGVGLVPLEAGGRQTVLEIGAARPGACAEVVLVAPGAAPPSPPPPPAPPPATGLARAFDLAVDAERMPCLRSHRLDGRCVVPAALLVEWLAHGALHGNPGMAFHGLEDFRVLKGVVLEEGAAAAVRVLAGRPEERAGLFAVAVEIRSTGARETVHARGTALLGGALPAAPAAGPAPALPVDPRAPAALYDGLLFHGPDLRGIEAIDGLGPAGVVLRSRPAPAPREWLRAPMRAAWIADPLAIDVAFQGAILWSDRNGGEPCLPTGFGRLLVWRRAFPREGCRVVLRHLDRRGAHLRFDCDFLDGTGALAARIEGAEFVADASLRAAFRGSP